MIRFSKEKVLLLHRIMAQATGGSVGVRDEGLLESALEAAFSEFGGVEFYPTKEEKAARLGYSLISNHAFVDGNKRIGRYVIFGRSARRFNYGSIYSCRFITILRCCIENSPRACLSIW